MMGKIDKGGKGVGKGKSACVRIGWWNWGGHWGEEDWGAHDADWNQQHQQDQQGGNWGNNWSWW